MKLTHLFACAGLALIASTSLAQERYLMALNSSSNAPGKRVMLFSPVDGSLINDNFIHESTAGTWGTVKGIHQVGDHIYISDQSRNMIHKYDLLGTYLMSFGPGFMSNVRGFAHHDGVLYVSSANAITGGTPANSIVTFDLDGNHLGSFVVGNSPFDVLVRNSGELLVAHSSGTADLTSWDMNGNALGTFHSGPISFVQQIIVRPSNGNILAAGWSGTTGIYEYDQTGTQVGFISVPAPRGIFELDNGNLFWTGNGFNVYDITTGISTLIAPGTGQYAGLLSIGTAGCYANCDSSTVEPVLNVDDFTCFINEFATSQTLPHEQQVNAYANCDGSTIAPALNVDDFTCFINRFAQGCP
jgi:hypothetical protein